MVGFALRGTAIGTQRVAIQNNDVKGIAYRNAQIYERPSLWRLIGWSQASRVAGTPIIGGVAQITTPPIDTTGADLLIAANFGVGPSTNRVFDNLGNVYNVGVFNVLSYIMFCYGGATSPSHSATTTLLTGANASFPGMIFAAFSGAAPNPLDQFNSAASGPSPGSITPTQANSLIVTAGVSSGAGGTATVSQGFDVIGETPYSAGLSYGGWLAYLLQSAPAAVSPTWTSTPPINEATIVSFKGV